MIYATTLVITNSELHVINPFSKGAPLIKLFYSYSIFYLKPIFFSQGKAFLLDFNYFNICCKQYLEVGSNKYCLSKCALVPRKI